jgi:hypothetical protein
VGQYGYRRDAVAGLQPADQLWALHTNAYDYAATHPNATARRK